MGDNQLKISLVQNNCIVGGTESNAECVLLKANQAEEKGSDLIIFPEMFLSGYQPLDLVNKPSFLQSIFFQVQNIAKKTKEFNIRILIGAPWRLDNKIYNVYWPGFKEHKNHDIAKKQMKNYGGMLSFDLNNSSLEKAEEFVSKKLSSDGRSVQLAISEASQIDLSVLPSKIATKATEAFSNLLSLYLSLIHI